MIFIIKEQGKIRVYLLTTAYALIVVGFVFTTYMLSMSLKNALTLSEELTYVNSEIIDGSVPVIELKPDVEKISKPFTSTEVTIAKTYYDYQGQQNTQEQSIIVYENTYMQNSGVDYVSKNSFDVISILSGTVVSVSTNELMGNTVIVKHEGDLLSVYQSISDVNVEANQLIPQGYKIGVSGTNTVSKDLSEHLHFELSYQGRLVNPVDFYNKKVTDL